MIARTLPKRYARALMAAAVARNQDTGRLAEELGFLAERFGPASDLRLYFANPFVPSASKAAALDKLIGLLAPSSLTAGFLRLAYRKSRLDLLPDIFAEFRRLSDERAGIVRGEVFTAAPLPADILEALRAKLATALSKNVILAAKVNAHMIGGLTVKIGSLSFDGSIRAQLDRIKEQLSERVSLQP